MGEQADDIEWFTPEGTTMTEDDWKVSYARSIAVFLNGEAIRGLGNRGQRVVDDSFYAVFNAYEEPMEFVLPDGPYAERWVDGARHRRGRRRATPSPPPAPRSTPRTASPCRAGASWCSAPSARSSERRRTI